MNPIKVLVADDHVEAQLGLAQIVDEARDMELVGPATTLYEVEQLAYEHQPRVLVLDLDWKGDHSAGIRLLPRIRDLSPQTSILAITVYSDLLADARQANVPVLQKGFSIKDLLDGIRSAAKYPPQPVGDSRPQVQRPVLDGFGLTKREKEVLAKLASGATDKAIAQLLNIAETTVGKHVGNILAKLKVQSRTEAAVIYTKHFPAPPDTP